MRCLHHLRAASGEWSNIHMGLVATTPLFEEETYRKVCRMGRDGSLISEDEPCSSPPGSHPWPSFLIRAYSTLPTSLFFSSPNAIYWRKSHCPTAKRGRLLGFGREVFFPRHKCSVERTEYLMEVILLDYIYLYILLLYYIAICLYIYIVIALFIYCVVCLLLYCMLTAWRYYLSLIHI